MTKAKVEEEAPESWEDIAIGDQVRHPDWGTGTVLFRSGSGEDAKAIVVFAEEGQKKLMLKYAKLKRIGSAPRSEQARLKSAAEKAAASLRREPVHKPEPEAAGEEEEQEVVARDGEDAMLLDEEEADIFDDDEEKFIPADDDENG